MKWEIGSTTMGQVQATQETEENKKASVSRHLAILIRKVYSVRRNFLLLLLFLATEYIFALAAAPAPAVVPCSLYPLAPFKSSPSEQKTDQSLWREIYVHVSLNLVAAQEKDPIHLRILTNNK